MELLDLAPRQRWSAFAARARSHPDEIRSSDPSGLTPLHWTAFNRPPLSAVRALLDNCSISEDNTNSNGEGGGILPPQQPPLPPLVSLTDVHGTTPLHAACSSHASPSVVEALVESYPPSVLIQDKSGWSPLHYLCGTAFASSTFSEQEGQDGLESVRLLITTDPRCVAIVDGEGQTPLDLLCEVMGAHHDPGWQFGRRLSRGSVEAEIDSTTTIAVTAVTVNGGQSAESAAEECFWSLAKELVEAMYCQSIQVDQVTRDLPPVLHQLMSLSVPSDLVRYVLARYPRQALEFNNDLKLPLHIAVQTNTQDVGTINDLLAANPDAIRVRDGDGKLPLQYAIEFRSIPIIRTLLKSYPEALQACRFNCALFPFIMNTAVMQNETRGDQLATVFRILRSKPDLVDDSDVRTSM